MLLLLLTRKYFHLLLFTVIMGCQLQGRGPSDPVKKDVTSRDLIRTARQHQKILIVDGWENQDYGRKLRELVDGTHINNWELVVKDHSQVSRQEISTVPTMLIGTPGQNSWIRDLTQDLPINIISNRLVLEDLTYDAQTHAGVLSYHPNPLNVRMPLGMFLSENEELVWLLTESRITSFLWGNWNYEILLNQQRVLLGNYSQNPETRWEYDSNQQIALSPEVKHQWLARPFHFYSYGEALDQNKLSFLTVACQKEYRNILDFCQADFNGDIKYYIYPSTEIKGLMTGNTDQSHLNQDSYEVHTAFDDHFLDSYSGKETKLLVFSLLGPSSFEALQTGLSVYFTKNWQKRGYQYWARRLIGSGNGITVKQLLDADEFAHSSSLIKDALSGSLVQFLVEHWGRDEFLIRYRNWTPDSAELASLNQQWWSWVQVTIATDDITLPVGHHEETFPFIKGFNFTHEGYQIYNGYGSDLSSNSLERVKRLGSNAVAVVPFGWMRDPGTPGRFRFSARAGSENDEGVVHAICEARKQGLLTIMKPHVWISNSWPGEVNMGSEENWDKFFQYYYQWISHYALLSEIYEVDMLCIGVEFSNATLKQERRWLQLIEKIRGIYSGSLTYAANWGEEFENTGIWEHLDYIGLNCYYPLSKKSNATLEDLEQGFTEILEKIEVVKSRYNKPVIFTEIGFRSISAPWIQPHEEAGDKDYNQEHQAIAYDAVFRSMSKRPVVDGILWWKWPTNPQPLLSEDRRFVPNGKSAEKILEQWFIGAEYHKKTPPN